MNKYPEDIMKAVRVAMETVKDDGAAGVIARAILAERKRCAKIASNEAERLSDNEANYPFTRVHDMMIVSRRIQFAISGEPNIHLKDAVRARITKTSEDAA